MESKNMDFAGMAAAVAHEIKNPLALIRANVELLQLTDQEMGHDRSFHVIFREIDKINDLIQEFIHISKPNGYEKIRVEIRSLMREVLDTTEAERMKKNIQLAYEEGEALFAFGNEEKLKQVLVNVLRNAADAVPKKGRIDIHIYKEKEFIIIKIKDNGQGIPEEYKEIVGKPFFTTKEGGSGLGLAISQKIIEDHQGTFSLYNGEKGGCVAEMKIPMFQI